jgi:hypothetical protein
VNGQHQNQIRRVTPGDVDFDWFPACAGMTNALRQTQGERHYVVDIPAVLILIKSRRRVQRAIAFP